jgi:peroxiredoxin-like protein
MEHIFKLAAKWQGGRGGEGTIAAGGLNAAISIPAVMDGPGVGTNPDEMLLGAASTCYLITLAAMLERSGIEPAGLSLQSEAVVDVTGGVYTYVSITHKPLIILESAAAPGHADAARRLAAKAEQSCMISKAVRGNVAVSAVPDIRIGSEEGGLS